MAVGPSPSRQQYASRFDGGSLIFRDLALFPGEHIWWVGTPVASKPGREPFRTGDSPFWGRSPDRAFTTLRYALTQDRLGPSDTILIAPNHVENLAGGPLSVTVSGVRVIGLGKDEFDTATIAFGDAASPLAIAADSVQLQNLVVDGTSFPGIASCLQITGSDCTIRKSRFVLTSPTASAVLGILATGATRLTLTQNLFSGSPDEGCTAAIRLVGTDSVSIVENDFAGAYGQMVGCIQGLTTDSTNLSILSNVLANMMPGSMKALTLLPGTTGMLACNVISIQSGLVPVAAAGLGWAGPNFWGRPGGTTQLL